MRGTTASYVLPDGQGSVRALANSAGAITDTYRYDAYGNQTSSTGSTTNPYRYAGQRLDDGTGLYQLRARSYDPGTGRFLSRDTAEISLTDPAQLNRYGYTGDNPINFEDPSGHDFAQYLISIGVSIPVEVPPAITVGVAVGAILILILLALHHFAVSLPRAVPVAVSTPGSKQRAAMRVQLQEQVGPGKTVHHDSIELFGPNAADGVTTAQAISALVALRNNPVIPKKLQAKADKALAAAISWVQARPANGGVFGQFSKSFYFDPQTPSKSWRFDIEGIFGRNLTA